MNEEIVMEATLSYAEDYVESLGRELKDYDLVQSKEHGADLYALATEYVKRYSGTNSFMKSLKKWLSRSKPLTQAQARAAINFQLKGDGYLFTYGATEANVPEVDEFRFDCFTCGEKFKLYDELQDHRAELHDAEKRPEVLTEDRTTGIKAEGVAVIENTVASMGLDLSNLQDARYAVPNLSGETKDSIIFLMVTRIRKTKQRDRRYTYGKIITGNEVVLQGTIEVKLWSSDSKELVGEQKPGDVYRGKLEKELQMIMNNPETFAKLFGTQSGHCCICGKTLTDDISRQIGMGLDCERKTTYWSDAPKTYLPECPPCKADGRKVLGKLLGFDYYNKTSKFKCKHDPDHQWSVGKDGEPKMLTTA